MIRFLASICFALILIGNGLADGQSGLRGTARGPGDIDARVGLSDEVKQKIGIDQKLGQKVPLDIPFVDEQGKNVQLGNYFSNGKPVIFVPAYYRCRLICNRVLDGLFDGLKRIDSKFRPEDHFEVVIVSMDHDEKPEQAMAKKESFLSILGRKRSIGGWHFLTGTKENIAKVMDAVGYKFMYDSQRDEYLHGTGIMVLTPDGSISRYLMGIRYMPTDLQLALVESSENKIGTLAEIVKLFCYTYDPHSGRYTLAVLRLVQAGAVVTMTAILLFMFWNPLMGLMRGGKGVVTSNRPKDDQLVSTASSQERQA